jgi:hypothetical protein
MDVVKGSSPQEGGSDRFSIFKLIIKVEIINIYLRAFVV